MHALRFIAVLGLPLLLARCSGSTEVLSGVYDTCRVVENCVPAATLCEELTVEFGGRLFTNAICTLPCQTAGALSPDCPRSFVARFGSCYPASLAGGIDDVSVCFEPCDFDEDCLFGFRCLGAVELCGSLASCPVGPQDRICVPGPS